jgi:hypothetical protein
LTTYAVYCFGNVFLLLPAYTHRRHRSTLPFYISAAVF